MTVSNKVGTVEVVPQLVVSPTAVSLATCTDSAGVVVAGGTGTYVAASGSGALAVTLNGSSVSISRAKGSNGFTTQPQNLQAFVSDGKSVLPVTVTLTGLAATQNCPP